MIRLAFYGKGGIGKSTTVSNLAVCWSRRGLTVLLIGCDPKADASIFIREGAKIPTVMDKVRSREPFSVGDIVYVKETENGGRIICAEAGGPLPGRGCAGRGIITALDTLREKGIMDKYRPDIVLYDILGDVVCGGFAMPMRDGYADRVYIVTSGENMSIYAAANIGLAVEQYRERGYARLGGLILNERKVKREPEKVQELADELGTSVIGTVPRSDLVQEAEEIGKTVSEAFPRSEIAKRYADLADRIAGECSIAYPAAQEPDPVPAGHLSMADPLKDLSAACRIPVGQASFPAPFAAGLEFNPPVHETWNIVHIGMLMPQSHQIYICADNCMRGVVMTAAEMNAMDRFSCVVLEEADIHAGNLEEITLEGVTDVLEKLRKRRGEDKMPKAVLIFPVCLHHFMGCDMKYVYEQLAERFKEITFVKGWMDPIMQKTGPSPDQKLRKAMMDVLQPSASEKAGTALLGDIYALDPDSELMRLIKAADKKAGIRSLPLQIQDCRTLAEYRALSARSVLITRSPLAAASVRQTARRIGAQALCLPAETGYAKIREQLEAAAQVMGISLAEAGIDTGAEEERCERALGRLRERISDTPIALDAVSVSRPLGFARLLIEHGLNVREIYLDAILTEEESDFTWLADHYPDLLLCSTIHVGGRFLHAGRLGKDHSRYLAVGPKAAWYCGTAHFVNLVDQGGMWGYSSIRKLAALMEEACRIAKDTRDLVPRKGLGCESMLL